MEKAKYDWNTFVARRRLNVAVWLEKNGVSNFKGLVEKCASMGVQPPVESAVSSYFKKTKVVQPPVHVEKPEPEVVEGTMEVVVEETMVLKKPKKKSKKKSSKNDSTY
jgi:hypothetical protein